jgi:hypothetical protein
VLLERLLRIRDKLLVKYALKDLLQLESMVNLPLYVPNVLQVTLHQVLETVLVLFVLMVLLVIWKVLVDAVNAKKATIVSVVTLYVRHVKLVLTLRKELGSV